MTPLTIGENRGEEKKNNRPFCLSEESENDDEIYTNKMNNQSLTHAELRVRGVLRSAVEAARLTPEGFPSPGQEETFTMIRRRSQWRTVSEEFLPPILENGIMTVYPLVATDPKNLHASGHLRLFLVGNGGGGIVGFDQEEIKKKVEAYFLRRGLQPPVNTVISADATLSARSASQARVSAFGRLRREYFGKDEVARIVIIPAGRSLGRA